MPVRRRIRRSRRAVGPLRVFLGRRLQALRYERGWSQKELGRRSGLSGKFVGEVERGYKSISVDSLYAIAAALKVPLTAFTDLPDGAAGQIAELHRIVALITAQPPSRELLKTAYEVLSALFAA
jgi:XRE family transcriptional regulator, regulator of sulfur utilization